MRIKLPLEQLSFHQRLDSTGPPRPTTTKTMRNDNENVDDDDDDDDDVTDNVQRWKSKNNTQEAHPHEC